MHESIEAPSASPRSTATNESSVTLDQWRGLALLMVLVSHGFYHTGRVHGIGRVGVNLFFFISGILVFRSLFRQENRDPMERARSFWRRRLRRLYPALLTYVVAMAGVTYWAQGRPGLPELSGMSDYLKAAPLALGYLTNMTGRFGSPMSLGHLWSLSCEMQFYLLAPLLFWAGGRTSQRRHLVWGGVLVLLLGLGMLQPFMGEQSKYDFHLTVWPMMLGFFCEYQHAPIKARLEGRLRGLVIAGSWAGILLFVTGTALMLGGLEQKKLVVASGATILIPCFVTYLNGWAVPGCLGRMLAWVGERTYSIYLWQQPMTLCGYVPISFRPIGSFFSIVIGGFWFRWFERPFLSASRRN